VFTFVNPPSSSNRNNNSTASAASHNNATIEAREDDFVEVEPEVYYDEVIRSYKTFFSSSLTLSLTGGRSHKTFLP
jgi:hypothetical protein